MFLPWGDSKLSFEVEICHIFLKKKPNKNTKEVLISHTVFQLDKN